MRMSYNTTTTKLLKPYTSNTNDEDTNPSTEFDAPSLTSWYDSDSDEESEPNYRTHPASNAQSFTYNCLDTTHLSLVDASTQHIEEINTHSHQPHTTQTHSNTSLPPNIIPPKFWQELQNWFTFLLKDSLQYTHDTQTSATISTLAMWWHFQKANTPRGFTFRP